MLNKSKNKNKNKRSLSIKKCFSKNKKGFTLVELIVVMTIVSVLVLLATPKFMNYIEAARLTRLKVNIKTYEDAANVYAMENGGNFPRLTDEPYTATELADYGEYYDVTGKITTLEQEGNFYNIDWEKLRPYIDKIPRGAEKARYVLQNPIGRMYYMDAVTKEGKTLIQELIVIYDSIFKNDSDKITFSADIINMTQEEVEEIFIIEDGVLVGLTEEGKNLPRVSIPDTIGESEVHVIVDEAAILEEANSIEISLHRASQSEIEEIKEAYDKTPLVHIALILDVSGSMAKTLSNYNANDNSSNPEEHSRLKILKETASNLIDSFKDNPNIYISIVPFSSTANNPHDMLNAKTISIKYNINNLPARGGTNTGDGLRRGYYSIKDFRDKLDIDENRPIKNIMFLMTDGVPTFASVTRVVNETITIPTDVGEVYRYEGYDYIKPSRNAENTITVYKDEEERYTVGTTEYSKARTTEYKEVSHTTDKGSSYTVTETIDGTEYQVEYIYNRTEGYWGGNRYYYKAYKYEYKSYNYTFSYVKEDDYFTGDNNISNLQASDNTYYSGGRYAGNGSNLDPWGTEYVEIIGEMVKDYKEETNEAIDSYVVGFSAVPDDLLYIDETAEAINAKETFIAQTEEELEGSFNELLIDAMNKSIEKID